MPRGRHMIHRGNVAIVAAFALGCFLYWRWRPRSSGAEPTAFTDADFALERELHLEELSEELE